MAYLDTPRTDAGNATFNGDIGDISFEKSFISPKKRSHDLVSQMRSQRGQPLRTPSARTALASRPNGPANRRSGEFTPLLQSVTKRNVFHGKENLVNGGPQTPAFLKPGFVGEESPALANPLASSMYGSEQSFLDSNHVDLAPMESSSAQSTPMAQLPKAGQGVLDDQRNLMTLREQENIIDKVEKENFGLKLKIHFLEDLLKKRDPNLNQDALKENTDLRVDKVQMQKELGKIKKSLTQSEKMVETMKVQMREGQARAQKDQADQELQEELTSLKAAYERKQREIEELNDRLEHDPRDQELGKLHDDIEDLEAEVREKQRQIDTKDDELDIVNIKLQKAEDLEQQVAESKEQDEEFKQLERKFKALQEEFREKEDALEELHESVNDLKDEATRAKAEAKEAAEDRDQAERDRQSAVDDLDELRGEMADKSFTTKGLSRQLEDKATKYETENEDLREDVKELQIQLERKIQEVRQVQKEFEEERQDNDFEQRKLQDEIDDLKTRQNEVVRNRESSRGEVDQVRRQLQEKTDEKELLQTRHDSLTSESQSLQRDVASYRKQVSELQRDLDEEKQASLHNDQALREEAKDAIERLSSEGSALRRNLEKERSSSSSQKESWNAERRELQSQKEQLEQRAAGLQRTVEKLQNSQGSLSSRETQLQQALESETQRHRDEQSLMSRQLDDLRDDLDKKRKVIDESRSEILRLKEEHRISTRDKDAFEEKIQALEDEVEVLQSGLEEESERAKTDIATARQEAENLRRQLLFVKQELARMESAYADARAEIEAFQGDIKAGQGSKEQLNSRIRDLESQVSRLRNDKKSLQDEVISLEAAQSDARAEIDTFQIDLRTNKGSAETLNSRIRELETQVVRLRSDKQNAQDELAGVNIELENLKSASRSGDDGDATVLRQDLAASRAKERDFIQKEARLKDDIRSLRREITGLETRVHEAELAKISVDSPRSVLGSGKKNELFDIRRQLRDSQQQSSDLRRQLKETERFSRDSLNKAAAELVEHQADSDVLREDLEAKISDLELKITQQHATATGSSQMVARLRTRIATLEKDLKEARTSTITDAAMASERADLHRMLQEAKLEAEDMIQLATEQAEQLKVAEERETQMQTHLRRVREERSVLGQKAKAMEQELSILMKRHEDKLDELASMQQLWDQERKDIERNVRFTEDTVSDMTQRMDVFGNNNKDSALQKKHDQELEEILSKLKWLKVKLQRESSHKRALAYEKQYLQKEIECFENCNRINIKLLKKVVANPPFNEKPKRTLRQVGWVFISAIRLRNLALKWATTRKELKQRYLATQAGQSAKAATNISGMQNATHPKTASSKKPTLVEQEPGSVQVEKKKRASGKLEGEDAEKVMTALRESMKVLNRRSSGRKLPSVSNSSAQPTLENPSRPVETQETLQHEDETSSLFEDRMSRIIGQQHQTQEQSNTRKQETTITEHRQPEVQREKREKRTTKPSEPAVQTTKHSSQGGKRKSLHRPDTSIQPTRSQTRRQHVQPIPDVQTAKQTKENGTTTQFSRSAFPHEDVSSSIDLDSLLRDEPTREATREHTRDITTGTNPASEQHLDTTELLESDFTREISDVALPIRTETTVESVGNQTAQSTLEPALPTADDTFAGFTDHTATTQEPTGIMTGNVTGTRQTNTQDQTQTTRTQTQRSVNEATSTTNKEWWARVKPGSAQPFEGKMTVRWKGYVAQRDLTGGSKSTPSRDEAIKRAMEKVALDKTMAKAMEEAKSAMGDGLKGKRKFRGSME